MHRHFAQELSDFQMSGTPGGVSLKRGEREDLQRTANQMKSQALKQDKDEIAGAG